MKLLILLFVLVGCCKTTEPQYKRHPLPRTNTTVEPTTYKSSGAYFRDTSNPEWRAEWSTIVLSNASGTLTIEIPIPFGEADPEYRELLRLFRAGHKIELCYYLDGKRQRCEEMKK
jgi:hypothetical protein